MSNTQSTLPPIASWRGLAPSISPSALSWVRRFREKHGIPIAVVTDPEGLSVLRRMIVVEGRRLQQSGVSPWDEEFFAAGDRIEREALAYGACRTEAWEWANMALEYSAQWQRSEDSPLGADGIATQEDRCIK